MNLDVDNKARLVFVALLLVSGVAALGWYRLSASRYTTYEVRTDDSVSGLIADAPVEFHGVDVGRVKTVELVDARSVRILVSVERVAPVTVATVARITTRGLAARGFTGYVFVSLENAGSDSRGLVARPGEEYPLIPTAPSASISIDTAMSRMDRNVQRVTDRMDEVLDPETVASLKQSVDNLRRVTKTLADNSAKLSTIVANGERASRQLQPLLASSNETLSVLETRVLPETQHALASLDQLDRQLEPLVVSSANTVRAFQTQILPEAHRTLTDLDDLSTSLSGFARQVSNDPSVIVRGVAPRPPDLAKER